MSPELWADVQRACHQLGKSARGRMALATLVTWMNDTGAGLDADNQEAVFTLLDALWSGSIGSTLNEIQETLER